MDFFQWWINTFGKWEWSNFWAFLGIGANVGLGWIAIKALRASQAQAKAAEVQTQQLLIADKAEAARVRRLLLPSIYASLKQHNSRFSLMLVNGSQYPIVIDDVLFNGDLVRRPYDTPIKSFIFEGNQLLSADMQFSYKMIKPGEAIELACGKYWDWIFTMNYEYFKDNPVYIMRDTGNMIEFADPYGVPVPLERVHSDTLSFYLKIPFAYISPEAKSYELLVHFFGNREARYLGVSGSHIVQWDTKKIFAEVMEDTLIKDDSQLSSKS